MITALKSFKDFGKNIRNVIYKITSPSGKVYIGQTVHFYKRMTVYGGGHCKEQIKLYRSFLKHGINNHTVEILERCDNSDTLNLLEEQYIIKYDSFQNGLNCNLGGGVCKKYTDSFCLELLKLNHEGLNFSQIGRLYNIDFAVVSYLIRRVGIAIKHKKIFLEKQKRAVRSNKYIIPEYAKDENNDLVQVVSKRFDGHLRISEWHNCCNRLAKKITINII